MYTKEFLCAGVSKRYITTNQKLQKEDIEAAALQFVRKVSGYRKPSVANQAAFDAAVAEISHTVEHLLADLHTKTAPKIR